MKHPFVLALMAGLAVLVVAFALPLLHMGRGDAAPPARHLPWQAEPRADGGLQVFGLTLGRDTLADAQATLGDHLEMALVARRDEVGRLEALVDPFPAGFVNGRLVLAFDVPASTLARWRDRATGSDAMEGSVRRFSLHADDRAEARSARIAGLSFVPSVKLTEADIEQRFGRPSERREMADGARVLLYPERGIAAAVAASGTSRGVLQYVPPRDFEARLRAPLGGASQPGHVTRPAI